MYEKVVWLKSWILIDPHSLLYSQHKKPWNKPEHTEQFPTALQETMVLLKFHKQPPSFEGTASLAHLVWQVTTMWNFYRLVLLPSV